MFTNRLVLVGISLLAIVGGGVYFSLSPNNIGQGNALVESRNASGTSATSATSFKSCSFETSGTPKHGQVIINEIAWMGTKGSANGEWIELKNISSSTANMGGWGLVNQNEKIKVVFKSGAKILTGGFYFLERGSADFLTGIKSDTFFTGSLKNNGDSFRLFDKDCNLIDEVISSSSWPAGDNTSKKTMERDSETFKWHTSKVVGGTPKEENDQGSMVPPSQSYGGQSNGQGKTIVIPASPERSRGTKVIQQNHASGPGIQGRTLDSIINILDSRLHGNDNTLYSINSTPPSLTKSNVDHILISQVQITGGAGKTDNDFIEIYNPIDEQFNLRGYRLVKRAQNGTSDTLIKSWTADTFIPAYGFYLWANSGYTDISVAPDATTSETLSNDNGIAIRLGSNDIGTIIDSVAWGKTQNIFIEGAVFPSNPGVNQDLLRKSWQNSCVAASLDASIGNGCDTGNNAGDFELIQVSEARDSRVR